jgi:hypothetical protein
LVIDQKSREKERKTRINTKEAQAKKPFYHVKALRARRGQEGEDDYKELLKKVQLKMK